MVVLDGRVPVATAKPVDVVYLGVQDDVIHYLAPYSVLRIGAVYVVPLPDGAYRRVVVDDTLASDGVTDDLTYHEGKADAALRLYSQLL